MHSPLGSVNKEKRLLKCCRFSGNGMVLMSLSPQTARHEWIEFVCDAVELAINCKK